MPLRIGEIDEVLRGGIAGQYNGRGSKHGGGCAREQRGTVGAAKHHERRMLLADRHEIADDARE